MIDVHAHILPGIDDGPRTVADSLLMMKQAQEFGVEAICATPHILDRVTPDLETAIYRAFDLVGRQAEESGLKVRLLLGSEIYLRPDVATLRRHGFFSLDRGGRYVLLELPLGRFPLGADRLIYDLRLEGITPVIAHPERSLVKPEQLQQVDGLVRQGALMQINAGSMLGRFGRLAGRMAERLLDQGLVHVIASDAHDVQDRSFRLLADAYHRTIGIIGRSQAEALFVHNPQKMLAGRSLTRGEQPGASLFEQAEEKNSHRREWHERAKQDITHMEKPMPGGAA
jgi:protein-tyrosine phosphatase